MLVEFGPLKTVHAALKGHVVSAGGGERLSLHALTGLPFWVWAVIFAVPTFIVGFRRLRRNTGPNDNGDDSGKVWERTATRPWKPWLAVLAIGLLMVPAYLSSSASGRNYPLGVTHGVMQAELLLIDSDFNHVYQPAVAPNSSTPAGKPSTPANPPGGKKVVWWLVLLILALMLGSWVSAKMSGRAKLQRKPPDEILFALLGGLLVGIGAALATGCVVGNIMSGWALMSLGMILFGVVTVLANWVATYFYMMGGELGR